MTAQLNVRLLVVVGAMAALALGLFVLTVGRRQPPTPEPQPITPAVRAKAERSARPQTRVAREKPRSAPARRAERRATVAPRSRPRPVTPAVAQGLPAPLARALMRDRVVVVSLFVPRAAVDDVALREAEAGSALAGAGFVSINVLEENAARTLADKIDALETPAVLVFRRPGRVVVRIDGFADRQTVAQAATNAAR